MYKAKTDYFMKQIYEAYKKNYENIQSNYNLETIFYIDELFNTLLVYNEIISNEFKTIHDFKRFDYYHILIDVFPKHIYCYDLRIGLIKRYYYEIQYFEREVREYEELKELCRQ